MLKQSSLAEEKVRYGFQMVKTKWLPFCFDHSKTGQKSPVFRWLGVAYTIL
jgi:hypothetical protein